MSNVGFATLTIIPSAKGFASKLGDEVAPGLGKSGKAGGQALGGNILSSTKGALGPIAGVMAGVFATASIVSWGKAQIDALARVGQINAQTANVIKSTGGAAGVTADHVESLAGKLELLTGTEGEAVQEGANLLLTFKNIRNGVGEGNDIFDQTTTSLVDMARAMGQDPQSAAIQLGKALNDPVQGIAALNRVGITFSDSQKGVIKSLVESGDVMGAQKIILAELNSQFGGSGQAYAATYAGKIELLGHAWGNFGEAIFSSATPALGAIAGGLANFLNNVLTPGVGQIQAFGGLVGGILFGGDFAGGAPFGIQEDSGLVDFLFSIREAVIGVFSILGQGDFKPFAGLQEDSGVVDFLFDLRDTAGQVLSAFAPFGAQIAAAFSTLGPAVLAVLPSLSPLGLVLQSLLPILPTLAGLLGQVAATLATVLGTALTALAPILATVSGALVQLISGVLVAALPVASMLIQTFAGLLATVAPIVTGILTAVLPLVAGLLTGLMPIITTLISTLLPPLAVVFTQVLSAVMPVVSALLGALIPVLSALIAAVLPVIQVLAAVLTPVIQALMPVVTTVFGVIVNVVRAAMQIVQGIIQVVTGVISGNWGQVWAGLGSIVAGAWNLIKSLVVGALNIVKSVIGAALGLIRSIFSSAWNALAGVVSSAWSGITGAIRSGVSSAVSFVSGLPDQILGALAGMGTLLVSVGSNMMQGLINGAKSMAGRIAEAVLAPIRNAVDGVKSFLGIHSPSRLLHSIGVFTGEGMANGLTATKGLIARASSVLVPTIPTPPSVPAPVVRSGGVGGAVDESAYGGRSGGPLIGALTLQSSGDVKSDLDEVNFFLQTKTRGGRFA